MANRSKRKTMEHSKERRKRKPGCSFLKTFLGSATGIFLLFQFHIHRHYFAQHIHSNISQQQQQHDYDYGDELRFMTGSIANHLTDFRGVGRTTTTNQKTTSPTRTNNHPQYNRHQHHPKHHPKHHHPKKHHPKHHRDDEDKDSIWKRDFSRIPAYLEGSNNSSLFGYVLRDLSNRFLLPSSDQQKRRRLLQRGKPSTVLVVCPEADAWRNRIEENRIASIASKKELIKSLGYNVGRSFLVESIVHGHNTIAVDSNTGATNNHASKKAAAVIENILLAIIDPEQGQEDAVISGPLEEWIRSGKIEFATFRLSGTNTNLRSGGATTTGDRDTEIEMNGLDAARIFLHSGYKLQVLSSSHAPRDGLNPYGPNTLLKTVEGLERFLRFGAGLAKSARSDRSFNDIHNTNSTNHSSSTFHSILFATRGLELAIPTRPAYLNVTKYGSDFVLDVESAGVPFRACTKQSNETFLKFDNDRIKMSCFGRKLSFQNDGVQRLRQSIRDGDVVIDAELWLGHQNVSLAEAACLKCTKNTTASSSIDNDNYSDDAIAIDDGGVHFKRNVKAESEATSESKSDSKSESRSEKNSNASTETNDSDNNSDEDEDDNDNDDYDKRNIIVERACKTRIVPRKYKSCQGNEVSTANCNTSNGGRGKNLLAIEIKGANRQMLNSTLLNLVKVLRMTGLYHFPRFARSETIEGENDHEKWLALWNTNGNDENSNRYRGSNQCDLSFRNNSNDSSILYHGSQIGGLFCFDYERPNCLAGIRTANYLTNHAFEFILSKRKEKQRWASFITLIDGEEETETLVGALYPPLKKLILGISFAFTDTEMNNTDIIVFSDDVQEPVLFLNFDDTKMLRLLDRTSSLFTSDLYRIMEAKVTDKEARLEDIAPAKNSDSYFDAGDHNKDRLSIGNELVAPPSVLSFYADIPKGQKYEIIERLPEPSTKRAIVDPDVGCICATNKADWKPCDQHPWYIFDRPHYAEFYILVECPDRPLQLEINLRSNPRLLTRSRKNTRTHRFRSSSKNPAINIMFLELDSVSQEYADRHFPKTRELLKRYRIKRNDRNEYECINGTCSAEFPFTALVGANSIPNQVAALSGCTSSTTKELCGIPYTSNMNESLIGEICNDPNMKHNGLRLERVRLSTKTAFWCPNRDKGIQTPWLFGVSNSIGYINFFGEDFCYDHSPYVTQGNVFPKFYQDIQSHYVFCSLVGLQTIKQNITLPEKHYWGFPLDGVCLEGNTCSKNAEKSTISLQFMEQMWKVYKTKPKFAFLNAIAAHDYSSDWEMMIPKAEIYDEHIYEFLEKLISQTDSNTVIIIRSDHGLQKGPNSMDYSLQVEHRHPWTEIIVPEDLVVSKEALFNNQARMVTGFDLYSTMRSLMSDRTDKRDSGSGIPDWSFDLLSEEISHDRTCEDAMADLNLCQGVRQIRKYGICNSLEADQKRFC